LPPQDDVNPAMIPASGEFDFIAKTRPDGDDRRRFDVGGETDRINRSQSRCQIDWLNVDKLSDELELVETKFRIQEAFKWRTF
jgi:hypothetical protein